MKSFGDLIIDQTEEEILSGLASLPEDPKAIAQVARIEVSQFMGFMRETGLVNDTDALALLGAAVELDSQDSLKVANLNVRKAGQPYTAEEILSFDRIKRAMAIRVLDRIEELWQGKQPMSIEQTNQVIEDEWQRAKEAVRSSPAAREAFRKYLERTIAQQIDRLVKEDKAELESLGVVDKSWQTGSG